MHLTGLFHDHEEGVGYMSNTLASICLFYQNIDGGRSE